MNIISSNLNLMIKAAEKASKKLIRDFGEVENLQVSKKGPKDFVTNSDKKVEKILIVNSGNGGNLKKIFPLLLKHIFLVRSRLHLYPSAA